MIELVVVELITLHMVGGREVEINPQAVQQLVHPQGPNRLLAPDVKCFVRLTGGSVSVVETCEEVKEKLLLKESK